MYDLIAKWWKAGKLTFEKVNLFARTGYITQEDAEKIKAL